MTIFFTRGWNRHVHTCIEREDAMDREELAIWLKKKLSKQLNIPENSIDRNASFSDYGLDSAVQISLIDELNKLLDLDLDPEVLLDYSSIEALSSYIETIEE